MDWFWGESFPDGVIFLYIAKKEFFHDWGICVWVLCSQQSAVSCEISHWSWEGIKQGRGLNYFAE